MWYMAYRDTYANMSLIGQTVGEIWQSKSENSDELDKHSAKKLRVLLSKHDDMIAE